VRGSVSDATAWVVVGTAVVWVVWDVIAALHDRLQTITQLGRRAPKWVAFALGFVAGHIFWGG